MQKDQNKRVQNVPSGAVHSLLTLFLSLTCVIFLRTVPARGSVSGVCMCGSQ